MARYHFNLYECGTFIPDEEGRDVPASATIRDVAVREARSIMASEVQAGRLCLSCRIEVMDEDQRLIMVVPFAQALEVSGL